VKEIMLLAARSVVRNMTLASALAPLVLLCEFRLQCARALDALNFSLNGQRAFTTRSLLAQNGSLSGALQRKMSLELFLCNLQLVQRSTVSCLGV